MVLGIHVAVWCIHILSNTSFVLRSIFSLANTINKLSSYYNLLLGEKNIGNLQNNRIKSHSSLVEGKVLTLSDRVQYSLMGMTEFLVYYF